MNSEIKTHLDCTINAFEDLIQQKGHRLPGKVPETVYGDKLRAIAGDIITQCGHVEEWKIRAVLREAVSHECYEAWICLVPALMRRMVQTEQDDDYEECSFTLFNFCDRMWPCLAEDEFSPHVVEYFENVLCYWTSSVIIDDGHLVWSHAVCELLDTSVFYRENLRFVVRDFLETLFLKNDLSSRVWLYCIVSTMGILCDGYCDCRGLFEENSSILRLIANPVEREELRKAIFDNPELTEEIRDYLLEYRL